MPDDLPIPVHQNELDEILRAALARLFEEESDILGFDIGERTICGALAAILRPFFRHHRVHVEYNRQGVLPKEVELPDGDGNLTLSRVFPDIIVHVPGHNRQNLLVIEVKKTTNPATDNADLMKLGALCEQLRYRFGVFVRISAGPDCEARHNAITWVE